MIRNGNHFVRFGLEWCLIDGPWFDYLESFRQNGHWLISLPKIDMSLEYVKDPSPPSTYQDECVEWMPRMWHPGYMKLEGFWHYAHLNDKLEAFQKQRVRVGYMLWPTGRLPPYLHLPELPESEYKIKDIIMAEEAQWK